jgi:hypothetical protein
MNVSNDHSAFSVFSSDTFHQEILLIFFEFFYNSNYQYIFLSKPSK